VDMVQNRRIDPLRFGRRDFLFHGVLLYPARACTKREAKREQTNFELGPQRLQHAGCSAMFGSRWEGALKHGAHSIVSGARK
jgi:hypothetical protein